MCVVCLLGFVNKTSHRRSERSQKERHLKGLGRRGRALMMGLQLTFVNSIAALNSGGVDAAAAAAAALVDATLEDTGRTG